jgi:nicotinamide mononucleotide transporter
MLEIAANAVTTLSIWLAVKNSIHTWWTGIIGSMLFLILFFQNQLYADSTLQVFFIATSIFGWYQWMHPKLGIRGERPITLLKPKTAMWLGVIQGIIAFIYALALMRWTNDFSPFLDAEVCVLSIVGQLLLMQRKLDNWFFWVICDTLSVYLYHAKGMNLTMILYAAYLVNAYYGIFKWNKLMGSEQCVTA